MAEKQGDGVADVTADPELIFVLVSPIGTPSETVKTKLKSGLRPYGYAGEVIKVSAILMHLAKGMGIEIPQGRELARVRRLMEVGDNVCSNAKSPAAVMLNVIEQIRRLRNTPAYTQDGKQARRRAWIIDSAKRVGEIALLRAVYGDRVIVVSLQASIQTRREGLKVITSPQTPSMDPSALRKEIESLVTRDLDEQGQEGNGQNVLQTFPMADVFLDVNVDSAIGVEVDRILDLLFGSPNYHVPTSDEFGMQLAYLASTRSPELGLKVGAAVMHENTVIALGMNSHPTTGDSSPDYDLSAVEVSKLAHDTLCRLAEGGLLTDEAKSRLESNPDGFTSEVLLGPLNSGRIRDLTEFQAPVHAEMAAVLEAAEHGISVRDARVYVTAYPCHGCAKHLLRLGLNVQYIEPYPKSRAEAMYGDAVTKSITPFTGIAPTRYNQFFTSGRDRKGSDGVRRPWNEGEQLRSQPRLNSITDQGVSEREAIALQKISEDPAKVSHVVGS